MQALKQSTATTVLVGPVLDSSGAAVTNAVIGDFNLTKNGSTAALAAAATATHSHNGNYLIALTTGNTDTLGRLAISSNNSAHSMAVFRFSVLPATVFDALLTNATNATGGLVTATGAISAMAGSISTFAGGAVASVTGNVGGNVVGSVGSVTARVTANTDQWNGVNVTGMPMPTYTQPTGFLAATFPTTVSSYTGGDTAGTTTLLDRLTSTRATSLDNLNIGGNAASQADILALNQSASRRVLLVTVPQYERPESGSVTFQLEARTYDGDGAATNADAAPTLTATGVSGTTYAANLSASSNPATGVYRWTYTVSSSHTVEQIRFDLSATIGGSAFTIATFSQVVDFIAAEWTTTDASRLQAIFDKLPSSRLSGLSDLPANFSGLLLTEDPVTAGLFYVGANTYYINDATVNEYAEFTIAPAVRDVSNISPAADSLGARLNAVPTASAIVAEGSLGTDVDAIKVVTDRVSGMLELDGAVYRYTTNALEQAPAGGGGGGGTDWTADQRTAIKAILGIPDSGTTPATPTVGVLDAIKDRTDLIRSGRVSVSSPVTRTGDIEITQGDGYGATAGARIQWELDATDYAYLATAADFKFRVRLRHSPFSPVATVDATRVSTSPDIVVRVTGLTATVTADLEPSAEYEFDVYCTLADGNPFTFLDGGLTVKRR